MSSITTVQCGGGLAASA